MLTRRGVLAGALAAGPALARAQQTGPVPLRPGDVLRGHFVQERHLSGFAGALRSEGHFVLAPGRGLIWQAETPFAVRTVITPAGLTQRVGEEETLHLSAARIPFLARLADMLTGTLAGDWRALEQDFTLSRSGEAAAWQVVLTPRRAPDPTTMPFARIVVTGGALVDSVEMSRPGGDTDTVRFTDQAVSRAPLSEDERQLLGGGGK
jgi:hypothetical protein